jgi:transglutaminase-like putative cysteine protease
MALHLGRGVCQDFAHILLALLRSLGIPCRYVSGHLLGEGAPHAWVEVLLPSGVVAYDPTHHRRTRLDYLTVAVGRDFSDVTMTSGVFTGAATGRLHWSKQADVIQVGRSATREDAAA